MKTFLLQSLTLCFFLGSSIASYAEQVVIVHPSNTSGISATDIQRLYLAKLKKFSNGSAADAVNQEEGSAIRINFDSTVVGKNEAQMKSYWAKLVFTGKEVPLKQAGSDQEVIDLVSSNPSNIGYIDASNVTDAVKVVHTF